MRTVWIIQLAVLAGVSLVHAYDNGIGGRPPMGWNTWCTQDACGAIDDCSDSEVRSVAKAMVDQGLDKLGYEFVNLDDCWSATERTASGELQPDAKRFPNGMKALADYVNSLGLKLGVYTCIGTKTCRRNRPGSYGHYEQDARTLASWGISFVKVDNCAHPATNETTEQLYSDFSRALNATGRPMLLSLCEWGRDNVTQWGAKVSQMFRIQMDHLPFWHFPGTAAGEGFGQGTYDIIEYVATLRPSTFVKQFGWLDPDFAETLFPVTMNFIDSRTEFSFWALWSAPLLVATDLRNLDKHKERKEIVTNEEVIAIDQDPLWTGGDRIANHTDGGQVWFKPLANGDCAVILYNSGNRASIDVTVHFADLHWAPSSTAAVRDLWARASLGNATASYSAHIAPHDVKMLRLTKLQ